MDEVLDILLCQRFLPEMGGSIRWMHEVYRRWPGTLGVDVITHDYYGHPPRTPEFPQTPARPDNERGDCVTAPNLRMDRRDIFMRDWGLESFDRLRRYWRMTAAVRQRLRSNPRAQVRVHCIHAVPEVVSLLPLLPRYRRRMKIICYAHGEEVTACDSSRQLRFLMRRAYAACDLILANSRYTLGVLRPHLSAGQLAKVEVVHPGVDIDEFTGSENAGADWREKEALHGKPVVLTVGRLDPRKNHAAILRAIANLRTKHPLLTYYIVGQGRHHSALQALTEQLGLTDCVVFAGSVDGAGKIAMLGACDVFAMPAVRDGTDVEGFGMVFIEAGACGKPVLAGKEGGQAEAVMAGETGLVVDGNDDVAVTEALDRLLTDKMLAGRLGTAGRQHAEQLDWQRIMETTVELVEKMGGGTPQEPRTK